MTANAVNNSKKREETVFRLKKNVIKNKKNKEKISKKNCYISFSEKQK